ncbi:zinc finger protein 233-like [Physella acuta]|uniref:zinc finger protein 233-like n=1 Tax=Physella acuta TaxID=109671 RepID=UPI0027DD3726|nr:zinc finger protein 233-like [Physella acuta]
MEERAADLKELPSILGVKHEQSEKTNAYIANVISTGNINPEGFTECSSFYDTKPHLFSTSENKNPDVLSEFKTSEDQKSFEDVKPDVLKVEVNFLPVANLNENLSHIKTEILNNIEEVKDTFINMDNSIFDQSELLQKCNNQNLTILKHRSLLVKCEETHTDVRLNEHDLCDKIFSRSAHLKRNNLTHSEEKSHDCDVCHKKFTRSTKGYMSVMCVIESLLQGFTKNQHEAIHYGKVPYKCDVRHQGFS